MSAIEKEILILTWKKKKKGKCHGFEIKEQKERIGSGEFINPLRQPLNILFPTTLEQGFRKFQGGWSDAMIIAISGFTLIRMQSSLMGLTHQVQTNPSINMASL